MKRYLGTVAALVVLAAAPALRAQVTVKVDLLTYEPGIGALESQTVNQAGNAPTATVALPHSSGTATAQLGQMHLSTSGTGTPWYFAAGDTWLDDNTTTASARATWQDSILVNGGAALAGTNGQIHAQFTVNGTLTVPGSSNSTFAGTTLAQSSWQISVNRAVGFGSENSVGGMLQMRRNWNGTAWTTDLSGAANFGTFDLFIPFVFGQAFNFSMTGISSISVTPRGLLPGDTAVATSDLSHTVSWLGVTEVLDANGNPVALPDLQSTGSWMSTAAIPEPSTYASLLGLGTLAAVLVRRRRR